MSEAVVAGIADEQWDARRPGSAIQATARSTGRVFCIAFLSGIALLEISLRLPFLPVTKRRTARALWLHRWSRLACRLLGLRLTIEGALPRAGFLVSNHLSYLDIIALSALQPCVFVAKREVARWPIFGWLALAAGTIFVHRTRRLAAAESARQIREALAEGCLVVLFPEGTSSDGSLVLPFKSALLQPAFDAGRPTSAAAIRYRVEDGTAADEVCYWGDATLVPHLVNLFRKPEVAVLPLRLRADCS